MSKIIIQTPTGPVLYLAGLKNKPMAYIKQFAFTITFFGQGNTIKKAFDEAVSLYIAGDEEFDVAHETCYVCGFPVDIEEEDCMCDDARDGDVVHILDDPATYRHVKNEGSPGSEFNTETPESIRKLRDKGAVRFIPRSIDGSYDFDNVENN